jgi:hypothetical protein
VAINLQLLKNIVFSVMQKLMQKQNSALNVVKTKTQHVFAQNAILKTLAKANSVLIAAKNFNTI